MGKHEFFAAMAAQGLALSFDDVRLKTDYSEVPPAAVNIASKFSRMVELKCPIVSSPMDTVTESRMAIAMAKAGGIGVIHRNLDPKKQADEVARVKHYLNAVVAKPICIRQDQTVAEVETFRCEKGYSFHSFPVLDADDRLVGLFTHQDLVFCGDHNLVIKRLMTTDLVTAPIGTSLDGAYEIMRTEKKKILPLIDDQRRICGMYVFTDVERVKTGSQTGYNVDHCGQLRVAAAIGTGGAEVERAKLLAEVRVDVIVIDTAHGDSATVFDILRALKEHPATSQIDIVVGNVSEGESAKRLAQAGADGIRVGQGPGSICTTRIIAGIGCPQVTAVYNCAEAVKKYDIPVCADGGINNSGDITVAIGAGAHSVMLGRLLAGTDEAPGESVTIRGIPHKAYRGMGSLGAMNDSATAKERYGETSTEKDRLVPEGVEGAVPYKGAVSSILHQNVEGLRRGMGYVGAASIEALRRKADFHRISAAGLRESHPHDVIITTDAPNYNRKGG